MAALYMADIIGDLNHWVNGWCYWNEALLTGDKYPDKLGGPNHDHTTHFGDPLLFQFNASGAQKLIYQPSYYVIGHLSKFFRPGATIVGVGGAGVGNSTAGLALRGGARLRSARRARP